MRSDEDHIVSGGKDLEQRNYFALQSRSRDIFRGAVRRVEATERPARELTDTTMALDSR